MLGFGVCETPVEHYGKVGLLGDQIFWNDNIPTGGPNLNDNIGSAVKGGGDT